MKKKTMVRFYSQANGQRMVAIPLVNTDREALMTTDDFAKIKNAGMSLRFYLRPSNRDDNPYIFARFLNGDWTAVCRFISEAATGQHVHYLNCNRYDLSSSNLELNQGRRCMGSCYCPSFIKL